LQVTYPYSGVELVAGQKFNLQWTSVGIEYVKIEYNPKNSDYAPDWVTLTDSVPSNGTYEMSFSIASDNYAVRISDAADGTPVAKVGPFKVKPAPYVQILAPNGNEQWITSKVNASVTDVQNYHPYEIKWNATNMSKVRIEWSTNGGGSWYTVPGAESTENDGSFVWAPGRLDSPRPDSSDNCRVRISSADVNVSATDETDGFFSIHSSKKIRINTPNGGEYFYLTAKEREDPKTSERWPLSITWTSYAISTDVKIYYSLQNGAEGTWIELVTVPSTGIFGWDYVFGTNADSISTSSTLLRIKVVDAADSKIWDTNDGPVNINVVGGD